MSDDHVDGLPGELGASAWAGPDRFPDNKRRRIPGALYLATGALAVVAYLVVDARPGEAVLVNRGILVAGVALLAVGLYGFVAGYPTAVDETRALAAAGQRVGFPVG